MSLPLATLLKGLSGLETSGDLSVSVCGLSCDSRAIQPGEVFAALPGAALSGREFISRALEAGAVAVLSDRIEETGGTPCIAAADPRQVFAGMAAAFHDHPSRSLTIAAVTGTNGKTTVTFLLKHLLEAQFQRCGLIGTVHYDVGGEILSASRTTPESNKLQGLLAAMRDAGCKAVAMEASSHAIVQHRVSSVELDAAVFTNLTQDHLDYHRSMTAYFEAKAALFDRLAAQSVKAGTAVINTDDGYGQRLVRRLAGQCRVITFGMNAAADVRAEGLRMDAGGTAFQLSAEKRAFLVRTPLIGRFNVLNALAALAVVSALKLNLREAVVALATAEGAPGRLQLVSGKRPFKVYVDYAHTPDALRNVLETLRELAPARLIAVFGCGGDRDTAKRAEMGAAAAAGADYSIVTSDNPRSEDPGKILAMIEAGMGDAAREIVPDRGEAIGRAVAMAQPRDIVLIAGKGHETVQEIGSERIPFDDAGQARRAIEQRPVFQQEPDLARSTGSSE